MKTLQTQTLQKKDEIKSVLALIAQIRARLDNGHYDFMSWNGRSKLGTKLSDYENYVKEPHRTASLSTATDQVKTLKDMETELRALLGSTY